jgi:hypothetical protein
VIEISNLHSSNCINFDQFCAESFQSFVPDFGAFSWTGSAAHGILGTNGEKVKQHEANTSKLHCRLTSEPSGATMPFFQMKILPVFCS